MEHAPQVFIVGAGPGHPGLLTLRAVECLQQADVVIYDKLVPAALLRHASPKARLIRASDLSASHVERYLPIRETMLKEVHAGKRVVRLKGGDPFIFGRGGEEVEYLRENGISYEIVRGVTSAIGASACAGFPLTHRDYASAVAFITGHENPFKPESSLDWSALARFPGTLAIYMGLSRLPLIAATLIENGKPPDTPSAVIYWGTTGKQRTIEAPLKQLPESARNEGIESPALIVIGPVVELRSKLSWFEQRPLFGHSVLITRPRRQAEDLARRLGQLGAQTHVLPVVEIEPLDDSSDVDHAIDELPTYQWLVFTSVNGVQAFLDRLLCLGKDLRTLGHLRLAAIGDKTAEALEAYHLRADVVPATYRSEDLAATLKPLVAGKRVLMARANRGRDLLQTDLGQVAEVQQVTVYNQVDSVLEDCPEMHSMRIGEIDLVTLTSSNIAKAFLNAIDDTCRLRIKKGEVKLVSISPVTSEVIAGAGFPVAAEASPHNMDGLIDTLCRIVSMPPEKG